MKYATVWSKERSQELTESELVNFDTNILHRIDGPAVEFADGTKVWWIDGKRYRTDGPAIEWVSGTKEWWVDGERHRTDGPAIEYANGLKGWYIYGKRINRKEVETWLSKNNVDLDSSEGQMAFKLMWI